VAHVLAQHRYLLLFATAFVNQVVLFVPVVPFLISAGALAARHEVQLAWTIAVLAVGVAPADLVWFLLGRRTGGRLLARVCRIALEPDSCVRDTKNVFSRYGARVFVIAKFIPGLSTVAMPLAGVLGMRARRFLAFDSAGALLWTAAYVLVGYAGATQLMAFTGRPHAREVAIGAAVAIVAYVIWRTVRRRLFVRRLRARRIDAADLRRKIEAGEPITVLDLRHAIDVEADPHAIPGAVHIPAEELERRVGEIPRDREIVLYCT
jgi:membrane protein DedA with SNARE-associated domain